jgi:beta-glucosidase
LPDSQRRPTPPGFLWGSAISAHQTEGNNVNSDAWLCETVSPTSYAEPSGDACDSWDRYELDFDIAAGLGFNCHRIGIEWSRIEPEPGRFSRAALDHYRRALEALHARGLAPIVTFNHFTVPRWFAARGGFEVADGADLFARYVERTTAALGDLIAYAIPFNEANIQRLLVLLRGGTVIGPTADAMLAECARLSGSDRFSSLLFAPLATCEPVMLDAQAKAAAAMKAGPGSFPVGVTLTMQDVQGVGEGHLADAVTEMLYGPWIEAAKAADFVGVQTYTRIRVGAQGQIPPAPGAELTAAGYEFYPQALGNTIRFAHAKIGRPILVTESGIATDDDTRRIAFIDAALAEVRQCLDDGIPVGSYICWSLLDNFEWTRGYGERFGLVHVDYETFARTPKPSAHHLAAIVRSGTI